MLPQHSHPPFSVAQPPARLLLQQPFDQALNIRSQIVFRVETKRVKQNLVAHSTELSIVERRPACEQFEAYDTQGPPICSAEQTPRVKTLL